jgi:osmotically-inducible protein OsmY
VDENWDRSDSEIKKDIERRFASDIYVDDILIDIKVKKGEVILTGTVGSAAEKRHAMTDCWVRGVRAVDVEELNVEWWTADKMVKKSKYLSKSDEEVKKAIKDAFSYDPRVFYFNPDVDVDNGTVTLTGVVDNLKAKHAAAQDARNTTGIVTVKNFIKVRPATPPADSEIEQKILDALERDHTMHCYNLVARVINQKAYLHGTVDNHYEKSRATDVVSRVAGVVEIENYVEVIKPWEWKGDAEIKNEVESQFFWSPFVDSDEITVTVEDGEVTLTGTVRSIFEADKAVLNSFEGGAKTVRARFNLADGTLFHRYYPRFYDYIRYDY